MSYRCFAAHSRPGSSCNVPFTGKNGSPALQAFAIFAGRMKSMTGYGWGECSQNGFKVTAELSSVNRKQGEISISLPRELEVQNHSAAFIGDYHSFVDFRELAGFFELGVFLRCRLLGCAHALPGSVGVAALFVDAPLPDAQVACS